MKKGIIKALKIMGWSVFVLFLLDVLSHVLYVLDDNPKNRVDWVNGTREAAHEKLQTYCLRHHVDLEKFSQPPLMGRDCIDGRFYYVLYCSPDHHFTFHFDQYPQGYMEDASPNDPCRFEGRACIEGGEKGIFETADQDLQHTPQTSIITRLLGQDK